MCANKLETEYSHEQWHGFVRFGKSSVSMTLVGWDDVVCK